jgi:DNA adenine methylase
MTIYNEDFTTFIKREYRRPKSIMFLDPPYYLENSKLYGKNGDMHKDFNHQGLYEVLSGVKSGWLLTYNNCEYIRDLYKDYEILDVDWVYGMNSTKESSEIVIINP